MSSRAFTMPENYYYKNNFVTRLNKQIKQSVTVHLI